MVTRSSFPLHAAALLAAALAAAWPAFAECKAPVDLEAKVKAHADAGAYTDLGTYYGQSQQFACSSQAFQAALKLDPSSAKLNYFLGLSLYSSGDAKGAVAPLEQSAQLDANAVQPRLLLAAILHQLGRGDEADTQWHAVLKIDPSSTAALDALSNSRMSAGDPQGAIQLLKPVDKNEDLALDLARAYGLANMLDEAAATLQQALANDPASFLLTNALTTVLVQKHRYQEAEALMQKYAGEHPDNTNAQITYLNTLVTNHDTGTGRALGVKLLAVAPHDFDVLYLNGILEREAGEYAPARDHLREAVALRPENYSAHFNLGSALAHLNDAAGARQELEKAIALDATQAQAHFQLAGVLRTLGQAEAAQQQLILYKQLSNASTARSQADTRSQLAAQKLAAGDAKQAAALYREAVDATPDNALLQYQLSVALDQAGDTAGERAALEQAVKLDPTFALAQNQLGYQQSRSNQAAEAEKHFRAAVQAAPAFIDAWINLAATLAQEGHIGEAQQAVARALVIDAKNEQAVLLSQKLNEAGAH